MSSDSQTLDVSVDGELIAKDGWTLSPDFDPDLFIIRSRLPYKSMPVAMFWAAIFPLRNELHGMLGPLPLVMNLGALLAFILWRKREGLELVSRLSLLSFFVMMFLFLIFVPSINEPNAGRVQRFWYAGWSIWFVSLAACFPYTLPRTSIANGETKDIYFLPYFPLSRMMLTEWSRTNRQSNRKNVCASSFETLARRKRSKVVG